jgi:HicA toxin of bacterial toxin-antitoxin,
MSAAATFGRCHLRTSEGHEICGQHAQRTALDARRKYAYIYACLDSAAVPDRFLRRTAARSPPGSNVRVGDPAMADHDVYKHPKRHGRIIVPRHRTLSPGVARVIAKQAGWLD